MAKWHVSYVYFNNQGANVCDDIIETLEDEFTEGDYNGLKDWIKARGNCEYKDIVIVGWNKLKG